MAAGIYDTVLKHLTIFKKEVEDENLVFKMFTKATFVLFILCAVLVSTSEFFGEKIICQGGSDIVHAFCWINGAKHVPESFITAIEGVENYETELSHWGCRPDKIKGETVRIILSKTYLWPDKFRLLLISEFSIKIHKGLTNYRRRKICESR